MPTTNLPSPVLSDHGSSSSSAGSSSNPADHHQTPAQIALQAALPLTRSKSASAAGALSFISASANSTVTSSAMSRGSSSQQSSSSNRQMPRRLSTGSAQPSGSTGPTPMQRDSSQLSSNMASGSQLEAKVVILGSQGAKDVYAPSSFS